MRTARHNAQTTTHNNAMPPTDQRLGIGMQGVIHPIFPGKEVLRVLADRHDRDGGLGAALGERLCLVELDRSNCLTLGKL